jgi:hypothetical protein
MAIKRLENRGRIPDISPRKQPRMNYTARAYLGCDDHVILPQRHASRRVTAGRDAGHEHREAGRQNRSRQACVTTETHIIVMSTR